MIEESRRIRDNNNYNNNNNNSNNNNNNNSNNNNNNNNNDATKVTMIQFFVAESDDNKVPCRTKGLDSSPTS